MRHKATEPTSPSQLPASLVLSPWQPLGKGCKPPTTSTTVLWHACLCVHQGELSSILQCSHQESDETVCRSTATLRKALVSLHMWPWRFDFNLRSDSDLITLQYLATDTCFLSDAWSSYVHFSASFNENVSFYCSQWGWFLWYFNLVKLNKR